jgi:serine/threonine-protein kinase
MIDTRLTAALEGRYELLRELGAGGMATVYLARDVKHGREVAIKVLHPELAAVLGAERFLSEIRTTASLQHPHILPLFDSGEAAGQLFYVMPYVEGETLRGRLDRETQLPIADAVQLAREVAGALQYAHERGVIHRDIKPENILLQGAPGDQHALVADFGIALAVQHAGGTRMTQTGLSLGTPQYMAPEQAMGERTVDARADIYALGAVTYEMLSGEPPFTGPTSQAIVARVLTAPPLPIAQTRSTVPRHVEATVLAALAKLPADRPATARAFAQALERDASPMAVRATQPAAQPTRRAPRWIAAGALAVGSALMGAFVASRGGAPAAPNAATSALRSTILLPDSQWLVPTSRLMHDVSRDGSLMVAAVRIGNRHALVRRRLNDDRFTVIAGTESDSVPLLEPRLSPGARTVLYWLRGEERLVPVEGGTPRRVPFLGASTVNRPVWISEDSVIVDRSDTLWIGSVETGQFRQLPTPVARGVRGVRHPAWLPEGRSLVVTVTHAPNRDTLDYLAVYSLNDGAIRSLGVRGYDARYLPSGYLLYIVGTDLMAARWSAERAAPPGTPVRLADGLLVADRGEGSFAAADDGTLLYLRGSRGGEPVVVTESGAERELPGPRVFGIFPRVSGDAQRLVAGTATEWKDGFWIKHLETGVVQHRLADSLAHHPEFTADSRRLLFSVAPDHHLESRAVDDATDVVRLGGNNLGRFAMSFTGGLLVHCRAPQLGVQLASLAAVDSTRTLTLTPGGRCVAPAISPDGRFVAYTLVSDEGTAAYLLPLADPARRARVWPGRSSELRFAPDGRTLFFRADGRMRAARLDAQGTITRVDALFEDGAYLPMASVGRSWDLFPDGRRFLMLRRERVQRLDVLTNWFSRLPGDSR